MRSLILFALIYAATQVVASEPAAVYCTMMTQADRQFTVNAFYPAEADKSLWYRAEGDEAWQTLPLSLRGFPGTGWRIGRATLKDLQPNQRYQFHFGNADKSRSCRTLPTTLETPLTIMNGGDMMHTPQLMAAMTKAMATHRPALAILGGDLAYADGLHAERWPQWFLVWDALAKTPAGDCIPMIPAIGNHEVRGGYNRTKDEAPFFYAIFDLPDNKPYFTCRLGDYASVVVLDSAHTTPIAGPQTQWLKETLSAEKDRTHLIACYHFPAYGTTKAPRGSNEPLDNGLSRALRKHWTPLFDEFRVDIALEHDHHTHKRSPPIYKGRAAAEGTLYLGDGAYGVKLREPAVDRWYHASATATQHAWLLTLHGDRIEAKAINAQGEVFDETSQPTVR